MAGIHTGVQTALTVGFLELAEDLPLRLPVSNTGGWLYCTVDDEGARRDICL